MGGAIETPGGQVRVVLRLDEVRRRRGIPSWAEVARRCRIHPNALSALATGRVAVSEVRLGTLLKLCSGLNTSLDELVDVSPAPPAPHPRADRPMTQSEFAAAVAAILVAPPPSDWLDPSEDDFAEAEPVGVEDLAARWTGQDSLKRRFGLR